MNLYIFWSLYLYLIRSLEDFAQTRDDGVELLAEVIVLVEFQAYLENVYVKFTALQKRFH